MDTHDQTKVIILILTHSCNLRCEYCYELKKKDQTGVMNMETAKTIICNEVVSSKGVYNRLIIHFMGGEPLLRFGMIEEICEWIECGVWPIEIGLSATTNGTLFYVHKEWLWAHRNTFKVVLSADGDKLMHDKNRSNSFSSIDFDFYTAAWPDGKVKMTISPDSVGRVSDGVIFLHKKGIKRIEGNLALGPTINWSGTHLKLYRRELRKLVRFYLDNPEMSPASMVNVDICRITQPSDWRKRCACGEGLICYDIDGQSYPCHLFSPIVLNEEQLHNFRNAYYKFAEIDSFADERCFSCAIRKCCPRCHGMNYIYTGSLASSPPVFCLASQIEFFATYSLLFNKLKHHIFIKNKAEVEFVLKYIQQIIKTRNIK